ncbi:MAG TPA: AFG1/ZapE family ATPase, partial [Steroidobacteraceae bacterium]|nr:AFG1/ZapE family ATPase [Steroidobacteraceae bacterium]
AREVRLLCLDEFHITDIGDAMLMRRLLEGLLAAGVALVTVALQSLRTARADPSATLRHE